MELTIKSMDIDSKYLSSISEENNIQIIKINKYSPSPCLSSSISLDRTLNQKFHIAALTGNLNILQELLTKSHIPIDCCEK
jgi:hypothetical protein